MKTGIRGRRRVELDVVRHFQLEHHDGDDDRDDAIAEGLQSSPCPLEILYPVQKGIRCKGGLDRDLPAAVARHDGNCHVDPADTPAEVMTTSSTTRRRRRR
jgi:hypothetical protein